MASEATSIIDFSNLDNKISNVLDNSHLNLGLGLFLILYAAIIAPKLSSKQNIVKLTNHWLSRILLFFIIVYVSSKNVTLAIIILIAVMATLMVSEKSTLVYVDQYGFNKLPQNQRFVETKDVENVNINIDNLAESETYGVDVNEDAINKLENTYSKDSEESDDVDGIIDESLDNNNGVENNFHPVEQGAMTSLGRSIKMLLFPSDNNVSDDWISVDSNDSNYSNDKKNIGLQNDVEQVTAEIEQEHGTKVPENTKMIVLGQLKQKLSNMSLRDDERLQVCRDIYRSLLL